MREAHGAFVPIHAFLVGFKLAFEHSADICTNLMEQIVCDVGEGIILQEVECADSHVQGLSSESFCQISIAIQDGNAISKNLVTG
jgi:hypothetical protein